MRIKPREIMHYEQTALEINPLELLRQTARIDAIQAPMGSRRHGRAGTGCRTIPPGQLHSWDRNSHASIILQCEKPPFIQKNKHLCWEWTIKGKGEDIEVNR